MRIPTYIITALYLGPVGVWLYWRSGPPHPKSARDNDAADDHSHHQNVTDATDGHLKMHMHPPVSPKEHVASDPSDHHHHQHHVPIADESGEKHHGMHHSDPSPPFYVSVLIGVTHCGAGCVL